jgi:DNA-3-methyladenine glycosylase I
MGKPFDGFDAQKIANYSEEKIEELMNNAGIVRNRLKINAVIQNAKAFLAIQKEFGTFAQYIWQFVGGKPLLNHLKKGSRTTRPPSPLRSLSIFSPHTVSCWPEARS